MSKYDKLRDFLNKHRTSSLRMAFSEIEAVLNFTLPHSAYTYQAWWSNTPISSRHSHAWVSIGWEAEGLDLTKKEITFRHTGNPFD